jgi:hypothetical protein
MFTEKLKNFIIRWRYINEYLIYKNLGLANIYFKLIQFNHLHRIKKKGGDLK